MNLVELCWEIMEIKSDTFDPFANDGFRENEVNRTEGTNIHIRRYGQELLILQGNDRITGSGKQRTKIFAPVDVTHANQDGGTHEPRHGKIAVIIDPELQYHGSKIE